MCQNSLRQITEIQVGFICESSLKFACQTTSGSGPISKTGRKMVHAPKIGKNNNVQQTQWVYMSLLKTFTIQVISSVV